MALFKVQENVPEVYVSKSRDFQLFARAYDCIINGLKYDIDSMQFISDTHMCRTDVLPLLQTKLGFFTNKKFDDTTLRYVLEAFPTMMKNKGSLKAIKQAIYVFLKINNTRATVTINPSLPDDVVEGLDLTDHTIIVGLDTSIKNTTVLEEIFKYILPTGYRCFFYYYSSIKASDKPDPVYDNQSAITIYVSDDINSMLRGNTPVFDTDAQNKLLGAVDTMEVASDIQTPNTLVEKHLDSDV